MKQRIQFKLEEKRTALLGGAKRAEVVNELAQVPTLRYKVPGTHEYIGRSGLHDGSCHNRRRSRS